MPFINDFNDSIDITSEQAEALRVLAGHRYLKSMELDKFVEEQIKIVPESKGYEYCIPRPENKMYRIVELK